MIHGPLSSEMVTHHHTRAVGVNGANIGKGRGFDEEGRAVAGISENREVCADFASHHQKALVGPFNVEFRATCEVEFRDIERHGGLRSKANGWLKHVV